MNSYFIIPLLFCLSPLWSMAQNCVADYGTIFPPEGIFTMVCRGSVSLPFGVSGNNTATDYSSVFVVTNTDSSIAFINNGNSISFAALPNASGIFVVHAMNIRNTDLALLQTAISAGAISNLSDLQTAISNNQFCADLQLQGTQLRVTEPITIDYVLSCDPSVGEYAITFDISGGSPSLINDSLFYYDYWGIVTGNSLMLGTHFTIESVPDGSGFTLVVEDWTCATTAMVSEWSVNCNHILSTNPIASPSTWQMRIAPQPAQQSADLQFYMAQNADVQLVIYDLSGKTMTSQHIAANAGLNHIALDLSHYTSGLYVVQLNDSHSMATNKLLLK